MSYTKLVNGKRIQMTAEEIAEFEAMQPTNEELIENVKVSKIEQLSKSRKQDQYSNFIFNEKEYINTETAQNKFFNLLSATTGNIDWRLANGEWVNLTREEAEAVKDAIIASEKTAYQKESDKITEIESIAKHGVYTVKTKIDKINNVIW